MSVFDEGFEDLRVAHQRERDEYGFHNRPGWDEYFLEIAKLTATRSPDANTKCGCVITLDNRILGTGYNGLPAGVNNEYFANARPKQKDGEPKPLKSLKHDFMIHAEQNCIFNLRVLPVLNAKAYITGLPCLQCLISLWQVGVREIICGQQQSTMRDLDKTYQWNIDLFLLACDNQLRISQL